MNTLEIDSEAVEKVVQYAKEHGAPYSWQRIAFLMMWISAVRNVTGELESWIIKETKPWWKKILRINA
jgi:hypothetical protein